MSNKERFHAIFVDAVNKMRENVPYDSGHLALNSIKYNWIDDNHFRIYVDQNVLMYQPNIRGKIANFDYATYINEKPEYSTYNWVYRSALNLAHYIASKIGGVVK